MTKRLVFSSLFFVLTAPACSGDESPSNPSASETDVSCQRVTGALEAAPALVQYGVTNYEYDADFDDERYEIRALDASGALVATAEWSEDDGGVEPIQGASTFSVTHENGTSAELKLQHFLWDFYGEDTSLANGFSKARLVVEEQTLHLWTWYDADRTPTRAMYAVPTNTVATPPPLGGGMSTQDGSFYTLLLSDSMVTTAEATVVDWTEAAGVAELLDADVVALLLAFYADLRSFQAITDEAVACASMDTDASAANPSIQQASRAAACLDWTAAAGQCSICFAAVEFPVAFPACVLNCLSEADEAIGNIEQCLCDIGISRPSCLEDCNPTDCANSCPCGTGFCTEYPNSPNVGKTCVCYESECCNDDCGCIGIACSYGDPHILTLDRALYDFQAAGEFVLVESTDPASPFTIQVRQEPLDREGACANVAINTGIALLADQRRVVIYPATATPLRIDGAPTALALGERLALGGGSYVTRVLSGRASEVNTWVVTWPDGSRVNVLERSKSLNIGIELAPQRQNNVRGLLGNFDGLPRNDMATRGGVALGRSLSWSDLYQTFADSYRIVPSESLFDYAMGETTETFQILAYPFGTDTVNDLPATARAEAEAVCSAAGVTDPDLLAACVLDVACTGDATFSQAFAGLDTPADVTEVAFLEALSLGGWTQEGDPSTGNWTVGSDGLSVLQSQNDDPTFLVSASTYINTTLQGEITVQDGSDNDYVGFVFGYQSPVAAAGDPEDDYEFYLLSWKAEAQTFQGDFADEGFTLAAVNGPVPRSTFWEHSGSSNYQVLGTDYGSDRGWVAGQTYVFQLEYFEDRMLIFIDGDLIFEVAPSAASKSTFAAGRFGFYNYSQPGAHYANFVAG